MLHWQLAKNKVIRFLDILFHEFCLWMTLFSAALYIKVDSHNIRDSSSIYNLYVHYNWDMQATEKSKKNMGLRFFLFSEGKMPW